jgi:hypothetical protein
MKFSKSHIDRLLKAQALPSPPWRFTRQFLRITSHAAGLTLEEHNERCAVARRLLKAIADNPPALLPRVSAPEPGFPASSPRQETVTALRLEVELERARHKETRLRYALREAQFLVTTMWDIISALRDIIASHDALLARAHHEHPGSRELGYLQDETQQALVHKQSAQEEGDRAAARIRNLEVLWEQARAELRRLTLDSDASGLALQEPDPVATLQPFLPRDLLSQPALDDIATALQTAHALNTQEDKLVQTITTLVSPLQPENELAVLLAATRLTNPGPRLTALATLLSNWTDHPGTRDVVLYLAQDADEQVRAAAARGLAEIWRDDEQVRHELIRLTDDRHAMVQAAAVEGLAAAWPGDDTSRKAISRQARHASNQVLVAVVRGLAAGWPGDVLARDVVFQAVDNDTPHVQEAVAGSLAAGWPGDVLARDALLHLLRNAYRHSEVVVAVVEGLVAGWSADDQVRDALLSHGEAHAQVLIPVMEGLATGWPGNSQARGLVLRAARRDDVPIRATATRCLATGWPGDRIVRDALALLARDPSSYVRTLVAEGLAAGWAGNEEARNVLLQLAHSQDDRARMAAIRGLTIGWPHDAEVREAFLNRPDGA